MIKEEEVVMVVRIEPWRVGGDRGRRSGRGGREC